MELFKSREPVQLIELFAGYGSQAMALKKLGVNFTHHKISEWEVNCVKSYKAIHMPDDDTDYSKNLSKDEIVKYLNEINISSDGKKPMTEQQIRRKGEKWLRDTYNCFKATNNLGSINNIHLNDLEINKDYDSILTYSFPCQDLSLAGKQRGFDEGSKTRSSLLWEVKRILFESRERENLPTVLLMENVNAIHNKKNINNFKLWLKTLDELGYSSFWQDMNAKDYGVAQNRNRTFVVSILGETNYEFPKPIELQRWLKDYLEPEVDEKYYINNDKARKLIGDLIDRDIIPFDTHTHRNALISQLMNQKKK